MTYMSRIQILFIRRDEIKEGDIVHLFGKDFKYLSSESSVEDSIYSSNGIRWTMTLIDPKGTNVRLVSSPALGQGEDFMQFSLVGGE